MDAMIKKGEIIINLSCFQLILNSGKKFVVDFLNDFLLSEN